MVDSFVSIGYGVLFFVLAVIIGFVFGRVRTISVLENRLAERHPRRVHRYQQRKKGRVERIGALIDRQLKEYRDNIPKLYDED